MNKPKHNFIVGDASVRNGADLAWIVAGLVEKIDADPGNLIWFVQGVANGFGIAASMLASDNCTKEFAIAILKDADRLVMDSVAESLGEKGGEK